MGIVEIMDVLTRHSWLVIHETMIGKEARGREFAMGMSWVQFKALLVEEFYPSNEMEMFESEFWNHTMVGSNHAGYTNRFHELAKLVPHLSVILTAGILTDEAVRCGILTKSSAKRKEMEETSKQGESGPCRLCFNCQKPCPFARDCRAPVKQVAPVSAVRMGNNQRVCYECGSSKHIRNTYPKLNRGPVDALQDPNIVTGTFSLNSHFATDLDIFDAVGSWYWLSKNKDEIVCHEKVVRIPLEGGKILRVQGERTLGGTKTLMSTKADEPELSDIPITKEYHEELHFLGHVVNHNGIHVDPSKIETVNNWKAPTTPSKIRSFFGLASYYRRFIVNFSKIAKPLTSLTQKDKKHEWGVEQEEAFQTLKDNLCNDPILSLPDGIEDFVVYCDATNQGLGCVLMKRDKIIAYASRNLKIHEKNYTTHDLVLGTVVFALKTWRHYLYRTKSVIYTDHKSLQHIFVRFMKKTRSSRVMSSIG
ncbi:putative reverse transcriptase domain-containing protein [Tanacetum coccineum]